MLSFFVFLFFSSFVVKFYVSLYTLFYHANHANSHTIKGSEFSWHNQPKDALNGQTRSCKLNGRGSFVVSLIFEGHLLRDSILIQWELKQQSKDRNVKSCSRWVLCRQCLFSHLLNAELLPARVSGRVFQFIAEHVGYLLSPLQLFYYLQPKGASSTSLERRNNGFVEKLERWVTMHKRPKNIATWQSCSGWHGNFGKIRQRFFLFGPFICFRWILISNNWLYNCFFYLLTMLAWKSRYQIFMHIMIFLFMIIVMFIRVLLRGLIMSLVIKYCLIDHFKMIWIWVSIIFFNLMIKWYLDQFIHILTNLFLKVDTI